MSSQYQTTLFGRETATEYSAAAFGFAVVALRVVLGWVLFYSGITKVLAPSWTASGYLKHAVTPSNPFEFWAMLAGMPFIDILVQWGLTLTGLGLILGALVRWNALWAGVMMVLFWASGLPLEHGLLVDQHIVYVLLLFALSAVGAGRAIGLDALFEATTVVRNNPKLRYLLG